MHTAIAAVCILYRGSSKRIFKGNYFMGIINCFAWVYTERAETNHYHHISTAVLPTLSVERGLCTIVTPSIIGIRRKVAQLLQRRYSENCPRFLLKLAGTLEFKCNIKGIFRILHQSNNYGQWRLSFLVSNHARECIEFATEWRHDASPIVMWSCL